MCRRRWKGSKGYIICNRIGLNILGGYQCAEGDVRGAGVTLSVIGCQRQRMYEECGFGRAGPCISSINNFSRLWHVTLPVVAIPQRPKAIRGGPTRRPAQLSRWQVWFVLYCDWRSLTPTQTHRTACLDRCCSAVSFCNCCCCRYITICCTSTLITAITHGRGVIASLQMKAGEHPI